jgi:hypothetical protein
MKLESPSRGGIIQPHNANLESSECFVDNMEPMGALKLYSETVSPVV